MLGPGTILGGTALALYASWRAFRGAPDRGFAVAAWTIALLEGAALLALVIASLI